jgi:hypothetical protein
LMVERIVASVTPRQDPATMMTMIDSVKIVKKLSEINIPKPKYFNDAKKKKRKRREK